MKKFLTKIFIWFSFFFLIGIALMQVKSIHYYGNPDLDSKMIYFSEHHSEYNTVFIGSSRIYRQVNPKVIQDKTEGKIKAFNLGIPAGNFFEEMEFIHAIPKENLKYVVWELLPIEEFDDRSINTIRSLYIHDFHNSTLMAKTFTEKSGKVTLKPYRYYLENLFHFSKIRFNHRYREYPNDGFLSIDSSYQTKSIKHRHKIFLKDTLVIQRRLLKNEKVKAFQYNAFNQEIISLHQTLKKEGIELILLIPPINKNDIDTSEFQKNNIKIIDLYPKSKYPELYLSENIWDKGHLNVKGAAIFSELIATQLNQITQP